MTRRSIILIYGPPVAIKVTRLLNVIIGLASLSRTTFSGPSIIQATFAAWQSRMAKIELCLQVVDNG